MALPSGARLGPYEIVAAIGSGGMGEVYRARDTKLNRDVAIKVLPDLVAHDPDRLARFAREAQLLASLNHPNIASIYGLEDSTGVPALVLELVDGPTLADMLAGGTPLAVGDAIETARQIAVGLEAAHDKGVIHRDLKPANVKRTPDGTVKILDFGLAKALDDDARTPADISHSPTVTVAGTRGGVILGTAAYMSPEQARGQSLDERTDLWAFGCIFFELLTGRGTFGAPTSSDVLVRVLSADPDWSLLPAATPASVRRLLRRCLEKDRKRRLHSIADARIEIEDARGAPGEGAAAAQPPSSRSKWAGWMVAAAMAVAFAMFAMRASSKRPAPDPWSDATPESLTFDAGLTATPAISADGRLVAYASDRAGNGDLDIWVQQITGGTPLRLTTDPADDQTPSFSPDGSQILFRSERGGGGVYVVSTLGGDQRLIAPGGRHPRFSPDGSRVAYWTGDQRGVSASYSATYIVALAGGTAARVLPGFEVAHSPVWSPDGRSLIVSAARTRGRPPDIDWWVAAPDGREPVPTGAARLSAVKTFFNGQPPGYQWRTADMLFSDGTNLWSLPMSPEGRIIGTVRRLTLGVERLINPSTSRDNTLVFASSFAIRAIERVPLAGGDNAAPRVLYTDNRLGDGRPSQTADGSVLVIPRDREIWVKDLRTGKERLVVRVESRTAVNATVSPDGARIAYGADGAGFVVETAGGAAHRVCERCEPHGFLSDSRRLLLVAEPGSDGPLRLVDTATGSAQDIVKAANGRLDRPHASPDDRWLAFRHRDKTFVAPLVPGTPPPPVNWSPVDEPTVTGRPAGWSVDSRVLYMLLDTDGSRCLWGQRIDGAGRLEGKPYAVRHFHGANLGTFGSTYGNAITAEGFMLDATRRVGNIWMLSPPGGR